MARSLAPGRFAVDQGDGRRASGFNLEPGFLDDVRSEQEKVRTVMSTNVASLAPAAVVSDIARIFVEKAIKRVPVIDDGKLVGIVSRSDLVRALAAG